MSRNSSLLFLYMIILLCGCSNQEERTCNKCESFFSENDHFAYPMRKYTNHSSELITGIITNGIIKQDSFSNKGLIAQNRLLTPEEYEDLQSLIFCFIGKEYDYVLSFFKDFHITPTVYHHDLPDMQIDFLDVNVCARKISSKDVYRYDDDSDQRIDFWHSKINGKYIFLGSKSDSINLQNCLEN